MKIIKYILNFFKKSNNIIKDNLIPNDYFVGDIIQENSIYSKAKIISISPKRDTMIIEVTDIYFAHVQEKFLKEVKYCNQYNYSLHDRMKNDEEKILKDKIKLYKEYNDELEKLQQKYINNETDIENPNIISKANTKKINESMSVNMNKHILEWIINCQTNSYLNNQKNLSKNLSEELEQLFGLPNNIMILEKQTKIWVLKYKTLTFNIFTAKEKGTSIELCVSDYETIISGKYNILIIEFLEELHKLVNKK